MQQPFDVTKMMEHLDETLHQETHDATRTRTSPSPLPGRPSYIQDSRGPAPGPTNDPTGDSINPAHYRSHPSGIECIEITRHMNFNTGNAVKYIWRYMDKGDPVENLKKAQWYLDDEIRRLEGKR